MEENEKNEAKFKAIPVTGSTSYNKTSKNYSGFGKSVLIPFVSGILGCSVVIGTCFGIPSIKTKIIGDTNSSSISTTNNSSTESDGYVKQISLENYSDTAVYAANKILPSIVGIKIEYTVNTNSIFGRGGTTTASASGSGIIISEDGYILTNNHVVSSSSSESSYYQISEATRISVTLFDDETEYEATIVGQDEQTDLAVIKIDKTDM